MSKCCRAGWHLQARPYRRATAADLIRVLLHVICAPVAKALRPLLAAPDLLRGHGRAALPPNPGVGPLLALDQLVSLHAVQPMI